MKKRCPICGTVQRCYAYNHGFYFDAHTFLGTSCVTSERDTAEMVDLSKRLQAQGWIPVYEPRTKKVIIEVLGGVADCTKRPWDVDVEIIDHDNLEVDECDTISIEVTTTNK